MAEPIWTIGALLEWTERYFREVNPDSPRLDAQVLLAHAMKCRRAELYVRYNDEPTADERTQFREMVKARRAGTPVAYLVGHKEFFLLDFTVSPDVLIPRPATETLVMVALDQLKAVENPRLLDVGTGSGCIAISILARRTDATCIVTDISAEALAIARRNAEKHNLGNRIDFRQGDVFAPVPDERFDLIVSNPPYVPTAEWALLQKNVRDFEPRLALDGGADGMQVVNRIIADAENYLKEGRHIAVEIGAHQAEPIVAKLKAAGFENAKVAADADGNPRVAWARRHN